MTSSNSLGSTRIASGHFVSAFDNIESIGPIKYAFIVGVYDADTREAICFVTSELNTMPSPETGSHFLCVFDGNGHANRGASNDWADAKKFFPEAMRIIQERFNPSTPENPSDNDASPQHPTKDDLNPHDQSDDSRCND